ncbi:MAG: NAD-binding protein, partial [Oscillospiraceae bacterium]|nr:NAD-binding protein [Oscillospiraceae bacterium]
MKMNIIIAGGGKVGETLIEQLSDENHDVVLIDTNAKLIERMVNSYEILGKCGNAANYEV